MAPLRRVDLPTTEIFFRPLPLELRAGWHSSSDHGEQLHGSYKGDLRRWESGPFYCELLYPNHSHRPNSGRHRENPSRDTRRHCKQPHEFYSELTTKFLGKNKRPPSQAASVKNPHLLYLCGLITPKFPFVSLGPAVKKSWFVFPLSAEPPPNSIPHSPLIVTGLPSEFIIVPMNFPLVRLNPLIVPADVLFETSSAPLNVPYTAGATANPHG